MIIQGLNEGGQPAILANQSIHPEGKGVWSMNQPCTSIHAHKGLYLQSATQIRPVQSTCAAVMPTSKLWMQGHQVEPGDVVGHESCHSVHVHAEVRRQMGTQALHVLKQ